MRHPVVIDNKDEEKISNERHGMRLGQQCTIGSGKTEFEPVAVSCMSSQAMIPVRFWVEGEEVVWPAAYGSRA